MDKNIKEKRVPMLNSRYDYICSSEDRTHYDKDFIGQRQWYYFPIVPPPPPPLKNQELPKEDLTDYRQYYNSLKPVETYVTIINQNYSTEASEDQIKTIIEETTSEIAEDIANKILNNIPIITEEEIDEITK